MDRHEEIRAQILTAVAEAKATEPGLHVRVQDRLECRGGNGVVTGVRWKIQCDVTRPERVSDEGLRGAFQPLLSLGTADQRVTVEVDLPDTPPVERFAIVVRYVTEN